MVGCATEGTGSPAPGLDEPVTLEEMRAVDTTELGRFVADCLVRDGWDVTVGPTGDVIADHADDQRDAYAAAADACFKEAIAAGIILSRVDVEKARASRLDWSFEGEKAEVASSE